MATTQENNEDLIILTDDALVESNDEMVIDLDTEDISMNDDVILTFDDSNETPTTKVKEETSIVNNEVTLIEEDPFVITEEISIEDSPVINLTEHKVSYDMDLDFGSLDLGSSEESNNEEVVIEATKTEEKKDEDTLDFSSLDSLEEETVVIKEETVELDMDIGFGDLDTSNEEIKQEAQLGEETKEETVSFGMDEVEKVTDIIPTVSSI
jgi:hypothetical protein